MAQPITLPDAFSGMYQDKPRDRLPKGKAWNMVDIIPGQLGAPGVERGGWSYASPSLTAYSGSATYVPALVFALFSAGAQLLSIDDTGELVEIGSASSATAITSGVNKPKCAPVLLHDVLVIPSPDGTTGVQQYDGSTVSSLTAAPVGQYAAAYGNRVWLANTAANKQRVYGSSASDATTWDTVDGWVDVSGPITGMASLPNLLLVFTADHAIRFTGSNPPPQTDLTAADPLFQFGCTDARSIAVNGAYAAFANPQGVFLSNGTISPTDMTAATGIKKYWRDLLASYDLSTWTLAGGWYGNLYVITVMNGTTFVDGFMFDVKQTQVYRMSNIDGAMFAAANQGAAELYVASRKHPRVYALSTLFTPGSSYKADGDGTAVMGEIEWPFYESGTFNGQRWRDLYLEYDQRDAASDGPTISMSYVTSPESTSYTTLSPTLSTTTGKTIQRMPIRKKTRGMGFKMTRANASSFTRIYQLAATVYSREGSRLDT